MKHIRFNSSDENVSKFVFEGENIAVEAVLYKYETYKKRTVICCSTQCGCPVGCSFCGTGKFFKRNLTKDEIIEQIDIILNTLDCNPNEIERLQIMFMSMGEPFINYLNVKMAIIELNNKYTNAELLISTSSPDYYMSKYFDDFINLSKAINKIGIQFSVHESNDKDRSKLISSNTSKLSDIGIFGEKWAIQTKRKPFFNYCVHNGNNSDTNVKELLGNFNPDIWECTLSVICEKDQTMSNAINEKLEMINSFRSKMTNKGYSLRVFNPAGQDDIGGGCGQLWYFQEWLKKQ